MNRLSPRMLLMLLFSLALLPFSVNAANQTHDAAIAFVGSPYSANQTQPTAIGVMVSNFGDFNETINASLSAYGNASCAEYSGVSFALASGRNQSFEFVVAFDCALDYSLVASVSVPFDANPSNNVSYSTVTVLPFPSSTPTPSPSATPTPSPSLTPTPSSNATASPSPSFSPAPSPSFNATASPSASPESPTTATRVFSPTPAPTPTASSPASPSGTSALSSREKISLRISGNFSEKTLLKVSVLERESGKSVERIFADAKNASFELEEGFYEISARAETVEGRIFLAKPLGIDLTESVSENISITPEFAPTGSVSVAVLSKENETVPGASVRAVCADWRTSFNATRGASGKFFFDALPAGVPCTLLASSEEGSRAVSVIVKESEEENISIRLELVARESLVEEMLKTLLLLALGALLALAAVTYFLFKGLGKREQPQVPQSGNPCPEPRREEKLFLTQGKEAVVKTLNERESAIVNYLLEHGGKASQGKIRFALLIPKTSFFRVIDSLEARNVVETKKDGNFVEIRLTDWFKGL